MKARRPSPLPQCSGSSVLCRVDLTTVRRVCVDQNRRMAFVSTEGNTIGDSDLTAVESNTSHVL